jgi:hypothetical protein
MPLVRRDLPPVFLKAARSVRSDTALLPGAGLGGDARKLREVCWGMKVSLL